MAVALTSGAIPRMYDRTLPEDDPVWKTAPVLQVVQIKDEASSRDGSKRRRALLSDGKHYGPAVFSLQLKTLFEEGKLARDTVICVTRMHCCTMPPDKRIVVVLECEALETLKHRIGDPKCVDKNATAEPSASAPVAPPPRCPQQSSPRPQQQEHPRPVCLIGALSPYEGNWTIEARVTHKSEMKYRTGVQGSVDSFDCTFADQSGEIRATAVNDLAVDLFEKLRVGNVYYVSKARVSVTEKAFFDTNRKYELTMDGNTQIEEVGGREIGFRSQ